MVLGTFVGLLNDDGEVVGTTAPLMVGSPEGDWEDGSGGGGGVVVLGGTLETVIMEGHNDDGVTVGPVEGLLLSVVINVGALLGTTLEGFMEGDGDNNAFVVGLSEGVLVMGTNGTDGKEDCSPDPGRTTDIGLLLVGVTEGALVGN